MNDANDDAEAFAIIRVEAVARISNGWWAVDVPKMKGVHTQGRTWDEALFMVRDAVAGVLDVELDHVEVDMAPVVSPGSQPPGQPKRRPPDANR